MTDSGASATVSCRPGGGGVVGLVASTNRHRKGPRCLLRHRLHRRNRRNLRHPIAAHDDGSGCGGDRGGDDDGRAGAVATVAGCPDVPGRSFDALPRCT